MKNIKLNILLAWDWVQENMWYIEIVAIGLVIYFSRFIHELAPYFIVVSMITKWLVDIIIFYIRRFIIKRKIKKLNTKALKEWKEREAFLDKRSQRLKLDYLNGKPVTIIDNNGTVWRFQIGYISTIISTAN